MFIFLYSFSFGYFTNYRIRVDEIVGQCPLTRRRHLIVSFSLIVIKEMKSKVEYISDKRTVRPSFSPIA